MGKVRSVFWSGWFSGQFGGNGRTQTGVVQDQRDVGGQRPALGQFEHALQQERRHGLGGDALEGLFTGAKIGDPGLEVHELAENGQPAATPIYGPDPAREEFDPRGYPMHQPEGNALWARRAGLDLTWLHPSRGDWAGPFPERQLS